MLVPATGDRCCLMGLNISAIWPPSIYSNVLTSRSATPASIVRFLYADVTSLRSARFLIPSPWLHHSLPSCPSLTSRWQLPLPVPSHRAHPDARPAGRGAGCASHSDPDTNLPRPPSKFLLAVALSLGQSRRLPLWSSLCCRRCHRLPDSEQSFRTHNKTLRGD